MKYNRILCTLCMAFAFGSVFAQTGKLNNVIDEVVWVVGDEAIMKSDVENARIDALARGQRWDGDPYCAIPEQLAIQKLFLHQAAIDSLEVSDNDVFQSVNMEIDDQISQIGSKEKLEEYWGKSLSQIREQLFTMIKDNELVKMVRQDLVKNIKVTPSQVRRYFKNMSEDSIPFVPTKVEVQIIVRNPIISQEEIDRVKADLRSYTERVNNGTSKFSTLAVMYSEDPGSARKGGELGLCGRGTFVPEFANAAFNLTDPKAVSKIVQTEFGYHIIQLIEKRGEKVNVRHILRKPKVSDEALVNAVNELDSIANEIRKGKISFDEYTQYGSDDKDTRSNYGIMVNKETVDQNAWGTSKFELKDLPSEVAKVVANMNIGEVSAPFIMTDSKSKEVVAIVKLKNKIGGHKATMADDYQTLQDVVVEKLSQEKVDNWIKEKMKTTYVRINEDWRNCEFQYSGWIK